MELDLHLLRTLGFTQAADRIARTLQKYDALQLAYRTFRVLPVKTLFKPPWEIVDVKDEQAYLPPMSVLRAAEVTDIQPFHFDAVQTIQQRSVHGRMFALVGRYTDCDDAFIILTWSQEASIDDWVSQSIEAVSAGVPTP